MSFSAASSALEKAKRWELAMQTEQTLQVPALGAAGSWVGPWWPLNQGAGALVFEAVDVGEGLRLKGSVDGRKLMVDDHGDGENDGYQGLGMVDDVVIVD